MSARPEYPRPRLVRDRWLNLNGAWASSLVAGMGAPLRFALGEPSFEDEIVVPFAPEWPLSNVGDRGPHTTAWYRRTFEVPSDWERVRLWFGAVDYACDAWVNDTLVGSHEGGHTPFSFDVTGALRSGANTLVVRATDDPRDLTLPRGKQHWRDEPRSIFYTRTTGIWQTVWLEPLPDPHIVDVYATGDGRFEITLSRRAEVEVVVAGRTLRGGPAYTVVLEADLADQPRWTPSEPHLIDVEVRCGDDLVRTYVGLRDIAVDASGVYLDGSRLCQRLVLDQGYWPEGGLTAPTDDALLDDIRLTKALGFDGVRKHQKVEDPRYLYHADREGLLVWSEMANAYAFTPDACRRLSTEWQSAVRRDRSHPCVVCWVPMNESWGVPEIRTDPRQQAFARSLYHLTKSLDATRPVVDNDGWEHTECTDLLTVHHYGGPWTGTGLHRPAMADGLATPGVPLLVTEFGGIAYRPEAAGAWGYGEIETDEAAFVERYRALIEALDADPSVAGWCYTQLTDVEQECNGLLTFDRRPKVDPAIVAPITRGAS